MYTLLRGMLGLLVVGSLFVAVRPAGAATTVGVGTTVSVGASKDDSKNICASGSELIQVHLIINGLDTADATALFSETVHVVLDNGEIFDLPFTQQGGGAPGPVDQVVVTINPTLGDATKVTSASFVVTNPPFNASNPTLTYENFNVSDVTCTPIVVNHSSPTSSTSAVPELDSIALFGAGALALAGFGIYQRRKGRRQA